MNKYWRKLNPFLVLLLFTALASETAAQTRNARRLTGTWSLDASRSDDIRDAVDRGVASRAGNSARMRERLENRLTPPDRLAIEQSGQRVTLISSTAPEVTFTADGRAQTETNPNGRTVQTTASLNGSVLS